MTEKRFEIYCDDNIIDNITKKTYHAYDDYTANELVELLNEFQKENEELKQTNVFTLINEMIETANLYRTPIKTLDYGDDLGYWNGVYQKLKELRDILENEQTRK